MKVMKFLLVLYLVIFASCQKNISPRKNVKFTDNWKFSLVDTLDNREFQSYAFDDSDWRILDLPHDWSIEGEFNPEHPAGIGGGALPGGLGWYRKYFAIPSNKKGKLFYIDFDGVYMNSEVWINGHYLGKRPFGYASFRYNLTPYLNFGKEKNVIAVKVDNSKQPNSRWYSGSGIYRNVWLTEVNPVHVAHWGTFVTTPKVSNEDATVKAEQTIRNSFESHVTASVLASVVDPSGKEVGSSTSSQVEIASGDSVTVFSDFEIEAPRLWSVDNPQQYKLITKVMVDNQLSDVYETPFGIRSFRFDAEQGFFLNGESMKIKGVCLHHDLGALGAAVNKRAIKRKLEIMQDMGVNAIRTAHNPPAPELLDLCDEMGFIVMNETFDMWAKPKVKYGYSLYWDEWHEQDLKDHILRDRNHPSVMIWSIGNEILEQWDSTGIRITRELASIVHEIDKTRPITTGNNGPSPENNLNKSGALDLVGFNYHHEDWADFPETFPGEKFIATETNSSLHTRGHYDMPSDSVRIWPKRWDIPFYDGNPDNTCSAYDNCRAPWGSTHTDTWNLIKNNDYMSGMFIWTGFDYLGEPTPYQWPSRSSYFGMVDLAGFPKDSYYFYKSEWSNDTVLHVFPHWNWEEGQTVDVWAYFNHADEVELFLNGESLGAKSKPEGRFNVMWRIPFEPGTLHAVSTKDGKVVAEKFIHTAGEPALIKLKLDRETIEADGDDLAFVSAYVTDKDGNIVPHADNLIKFSLDGEASVIATDNGDQTNHASFQCTQRKAFNGKCLAIIQAGEKAGAVTIKANSEGLPKAAAHVTLKPGASSCH
jgi:beta-galactosidase